MRSLTTDLFEPARQRLRKVPWSAITPIAHLLEPPLHDVLSSVSAPAERVLDRFLRDHKDFDAATRAVSAEAIFGVALYRRRLRALTSATAPPRLLLAAFLRDIDRHFSTHVLTPPHTLPEPRTLTHWPEALSWPDWLADELTRVAGPDDAPSLAAALNLPGPITLRANTLLTTREQLAKTLDTHAVATRPTQWSRDGLTVTTPRPNLYGLGLLGHFEVQDEGSQLLAELVDAGRATSVLDLCAGAGGKTLALACSTTHVHATDIDAKRLDRLRTRATHANAGARITIHHPVPPRGFTVERVLVDAPCSELGTLRRGPDLRWRRTPDIFSSLPSLQLDLISRGLEHLAPRGRLIYATCTTRREENEDVVTELLARHPNLRLVTPPMANFTHGKYFSTARTDLHGLDGFFAVILERTI